MTILDAFDLTRSFREAAELAVCSRHRTASNAAQSSSELPGDRDLAAARRIRRRPGWSSLDGRLQGTFGSIDARIRMIYVRGFPGGVRFGESV